MEKVKLTKKQAVIIHRVVLECSHDALVKATAWVAPNAVLPSDIGYYEREKAYQRLLGESRARLRVLNEVFGLSGKTHNHDWMVDEMLLALQEYEPYERLSPYPRSNQPRS